jgi:hypothetical protein
MIIRNNKQEGSAPPPTPVAPPPVPTGGHPRLTVELVSGTYLNIAVNWAKGSNVEAFSQLLLALCRGRLDVPLLTAISMHASRIGEPEKADAIREIFEGDAKEEAAGQDDPLICPTQAIRANMRSFQG